MIEHALFWIAGFAVIAGALGAATVRNLFHAGLLLGLCLAGVAALYLFLEAPYLACVQVIVYIGGVLVLVLFATLFSADILGTAARTPLGLRVASLVGAGLVVLVSVRLSMTALAIGPDLATKRTTPTPDAIAAPGASVADLLLGPWLVPFLLAGVLLTLALVGSVATVRRYRRPAPARAG